MLKKLLWVPVYLLAAALLALTFWLYFVPELNFYVETAVERETESTAEGEAEADSKIPWIDMPEISLKGVPVEISRTKAGAFLDAGIHLWVLQDGKLLPLNIEAAVLRPKASYDLVMKDGDAYLADIILTNLTEEELPVQEGVLTSVVCDGTKMEDGMLPETLLVEGKSVRTMRASSIPEELSGFTKDASDPPNYLFTAMSGRQSMIAYLTADRGDPDRAAVFGIRDYAPGSAGEAQSAK